MIKKITAYIVISLLINVTQILPTDSSCSTICPTCPKRFKDFCSCHHDLAQKILHVSCQKEDNSQASVTTACPVPNNLSSLTIEKDGSLPLEGCTNNENLHNHLDLSDTTQ